MSAQHIMIDLETLATTPDAVILSIGACRFNLDTDEVFYGTEDNSFYRAIDIDSQPGRRISASTLEWWMAQSKAAQGVFSESKTSLHTALLSLSVWMWGRGERSPTVWSNGADFDLPILTHAYDQAGIERPWAPYAGRCYRTYKNLPGARAVKVMRLGEHHNALHDSIHQATHVCAIYQALFGPQSAEVTA
jgi:hypothetical protein